MDFMVLYKYRYCYVIDNKSLPSECQQQYIPRQQQYTQSLDDQSCIPIHPINKAQQFLKI